MKQQDKHNNEEHCSYACVRMGEGEGRGEEGRERRGEGRRGEGRRGEGEGVVAS